MVLNIYIYIYIYIYTYGSRAPHFHGYILSIFSKTNDFQIFLEVQYAYDF